MHFRLSKIFNSWCFSHGCDKTWAQNPLILKWKPNLFDHKSLYDQGIYVFLLESNSFELKSTSTIKPWLLKMCHLKHRLRVFLFQRKALFCSQNIQVFVFLIIPWCTISVMSWWVLAHKTGCIFEYIIWTSTH